MSRPLCSRLGQENSVKNQAGKILFTVIQQGRGITNQMCTIHSDHQLLGREVKLSRECIPVCTVLSKSFGSG